MYSVAGLLQGLFPALKELFALACAAFYAFRDAHASGSAAKAGQLYSQLQQLVAQVGNFPGSPSLALFPLS